MLAENRRQYRPDDKARSYRLVAVGKAEITVRAMACVTARSPDEARAMRPAGWEYDVDSRSVAAEIRELVARHKLELHVCDVEEVVEF